MAILTKDTSHIDAATQALEYIKSNVDSDGWLQNTVDPLTFSTESTNDTHSPEGQAFVLLLQSAYRDYSIFQSGGSIRDILLASLTH